MRRVVVAVLAAAMVVSPAASAQEAVEATIYLDPFGVPHIASEDPEAMAYAFGYAQASERLFEMDVIRRIAQGRMSELLGDSFYESDVMFRREFYDPADVDRQLAELSDSVRALLEAYSDGVNRAIDEQLRDPTRLPAIYLALGAVPEPWSPHDSATVINLFTIATNAGEGEGEELENIDLYRALVDRYGPDEADRIWDEVHWSNDPTAPTVIPAEDAPPAPPGIAPPDRPHPSQLALGTPASNGAAAAALRAEAALWRDLFRRVPVPRLGSYAWALAGRLTQSGGGMLLGAPQVGFTFPSTFHEVGIHVPGWQCTGMTVPGLGPFVGIGWCNDHAWSFVAGNQGDQVDVYVETLDPDDPGRYLFQGESRPFTTRTETFLVKSTIDGQLEVRQETFEYSVHGPVFLKDADAGVAYTRKRAQAGVSVSGFEGLFRLNTQPGGIPALLDALDGFNASYNLTMADRAGHIAYSFTGLQPRRAPGFDKRFAMPGTGEAEWVGFLAPDERPLVVDPASGVLAVNQGVESKSVPWWEASSWLAIGRANRVGRDRAELIARGPGWTLDRLEAANRDIHEGTDPFAPLFAPYLEAALADPEFDDLRGIWEQWRDAGFERVDRDGDLSYDHPGQAAFSADSLSGFQASPLWDHLWTLIFGDELPDGNWGTRFTRLSQVLHALDGDLGWTHDYVDDVETPEVEDAVEVVREALRRARTDLAERYGTEDVTAWRVPVPEEPFTALGLAAPRPMRVYDHGTYNYIVDLGAGEGRSVLPPGNGRADTAEAETRYQLTGELPPHADDQLELYEQWTFKPMHRDDFAAVATATTTLSYTPTGRVQLPGAPPPPPPQEQTPPPAPAPPLPATGAGAAAAAVLVLIGSVRRWRGRR